MPYKCKECGAVFDEPKIIRTTHGGRYEAHGYEKYGKCPNCPSDEFKECVICDYCGEGVTEGYVHFTARDEYVCDECLHDYCVENYSHKARIDYSLFPERLKNLRLMRGLSRRELDQATKISQAAIIHYENGIRLPTSYNAIKLANYFGVSVDYLLGG